MGAATSRIAAEPSEPRAWLARAELQRRAGHLAEAEADLAHAETLDPTLPEVALARASLALDRGRPLDALRILEARSDHSPSAAADLLRARAEAARGRPLAAADAMDRALAALERPSPDLYLERADLLAAAGPGHEERARAGLAEGIGRLGAVPAIVERAVALDLAARRFDAALELHDRLRPTSGREESWYARRGELLALAGRRWDAAEAFSLALDDLERLPDRVRSAVATRALEARIHRGLAGVAR